MGNVIKTILYAIIAIVLMIGAINIALTQPEISNATLLFWILLVYVVTIINNGHLNL